MEGLQGRRVLIHREVSRQPRWYYSDFMNKSVNKFEQIKIKSLRTLSVDESHVDLKKISPGDRVRDSRGQRMCH